MSPLPPFPVDVAGFDPADELRLEEAASVFYRAASRFSSAFPTPDAALGELLDVARTTDAITFVALNLAGEVCGLVSAAPYRSSSMLRIHPLAIDPPFQRRGVGRTLLRTVEEAAHELGMDYPDDRPGRRSRADIAFGTLAVSRSARTDDTFRSPGVAPFKVSSTHGIRTHRRSA